MMRIRVCLFGFAAAFATGGAYAQALAVPAIGAAPSLHSLGSEAELQSYLERVVSLAADAQAREDSGWGALCGSTFRVTHQWTGGSTSPSSASLIIRAIVTDTSGVPVSGAQLNVDDSRAGATTGAKGEATLTVGAEKISKSRRVTLTARGQSYTYRAGHFKALPGDTVDVELSLCHNSLVLHQSVGTTGGSSGASKNSDNPEQAGVDAGDDVRLVGRFLVILRRGRLFSFDLGTEDKQHQALRLVGFMTAFDPGSSPASMRYDKFVVRGNQIVVLGYGIAGGGLEIHRFRISDDGVLRRDGTHQLRVDCAYTKCVARLAGDKLILFASFPVNLSGEQPLASLPAMRKWSPDSKPFDFQSLVSPQRIFRFPNDSLIGSKPFLNSITTCDLRPVELTCKARVIVGPRDEGYHLSATAEYVWMQEGDHPNLLRSSDGPMALFRVPLSDSTPRAIRIVGGPFNQLSLHEDVRGTLHVFASGDAWVGPATSAAGETREPAALFNLRLEDFGDGTRDAPSSSHRALPLQAGSNVESRFIGRWLLYAIGGPYYRSDSTSTTLFAVPVDSGAVRRIALPYYVERIASRDYEAVVVGSAGVNTLHFVGIGLSSRLSLKGHFALTNPSEEEGERDEFFYDGTDAKRRFLAVPGRGYDRSDSTHWVRGSTEVVFLRTSARGFAKVGALRITRSTPEDDKSLSVPTGWYDDWYGNARGMFVRERIFALIGYELIEGQVIGDRLIERQRINFMPNDDQAGWK
ncbi:MAG: carboxypeptidase-like regulatory domain-containing protein [Gemmatimonadaceae bacterium]